MNASILTSVKKSLGINEDYEHFDPDIVLAINSVFPILAQLGVRNGKSFRIEDKTALWTDYLSDDETLEMVKSYMVLKVKLMFDPPLSSAVIDIMNRQVEEFAWRLNATEVE